MRAIYIVTSNCTDPTRHEEFNRWYDDVHVPHVLKAPGMMGAQRFRRRSDPKSGEGEYLAIYEMDSPDPEQVLVELRAQSAALRERGEWIDCIEVVATALYENL